MAGRAQPGTQITNGRGVSTVPELTSDQISAEFPGNEWLVADIYDKYRTDRSSVDAQWADIFERLESGGSKESPAAQGKPAPSGSQAAETVTDSPKAPGAAADSGKPTPRSRRPRRRRPSPPSPPRRPVQRRSRLPRQR